MSYTSKLEKKQDEWILRPEGYIDTITAKEFEKDMLEIFAGTDCVRLDFEMVQYISSAGLRVLLQFVKKANSEEKEMICCNIQEMVEEILRSTGFMNFLQVE